MSKGRKQQPVQIKVLNGTYRKDRDSDKLIIKNDDNYKLPAPPKILTDEGLKYYKKQGKNYLKMGILNEYNLPLFISICFLLSRISIYGRMINECTDADKLIKYQKLFNDCERNLRLSLNEMGLTPASVGKIRKPEQKKESRFRQFINDNLDQNKKAL